MIAFVSSAAFIPTSSLGSRNNKPFPLLSYRAVRPTRWMYVSASSGASSCKTQSTAGKSSPRAAMSVAKRTACDDDVNLLYIASRAVCFCFPWRLRSGIPGCILQNVSNTKRTCLHADMKTRILDWRWDLMKLQSMSSFLSRVQTTKCCSRFWGIVELAVSSRPRDTGLFRLSLARSLTDWVWVAEKRSV